jgi:MFS family permease
VAFYLSIYPYFQSYLIVVKGESVSSAGRIVQSFTFTATITSLLVSLLIKKIRRYKIFVVVGSVVYLLGLCLMLFYRTENASRFSIITSQVIVGIGGGILTGPAQLGVQASANHQEVGAATAIFLTLLEIGGAVGNAISGAIWTHNMPEKLKLYLPEETQDQAHAIFSNISLAASGWPVGSATRDAINRSYQDTMTKILTVAVCVALPCVVLSFFMKDYKLDEMDQHVKGVVVGGVQDIASHIETSIEAGPSRRASLTSNEGGGGSRRGSQATAPLLRRKDS